MSSCTCSSVDKVAAVCSGVEGWILSGTQIFFVPHSCHVDQFTFDIFRTCNIIKTKSFNKTEAKQKQTNNPWYRSSVMTLYNVT